MTHARLGIARTMFALCAMAGALAACQPKPPTAAGLPGVAQMQSSFALRTVVKTTALQV